MATRSDKAAKVSELEKKLRGLNREHTDNKAMVEQMVARQRTVYADIVQVDNQIRLLKTQMPESMVVSNHALLRYAERRYSLPLDNLEKEILSMVRGAEMGADEVHYKGFVIKNNTVITYIPTAEDIAGNPNLSGSR